MSADGFASFGGLKGRAQPKQDPSIERELVLTLEEIFNGCTKKMKISRKARQIAQEYKLFDAHTHTHTPTH